MGGETRIVVTDRHTSLADISVHDSLVVSSMAASSVSSTNSQVKTLILLFSKGGINFVVWIELFVSFNGEFSSHQKIRVDHMNQIAGLDEQLSQLNVNHVFSPSLPLNNVGDWAVSDDDISEQGEPTSDMRKSSLPLQPVQRKFRNHDAYSS
ncbi:hypothetical protein L6452_14907 [Arctium lappa]|uniref:Uncharacterized protein n=1 Tax=Arctium lappa TaxID=4217 RepID=A0ACB9CME9_ARCLA|nr:hypothetical protein L6452_14907 [Arctium lappa]